MGAIGQYMAHLAAACKSKSTVKFVAVTLWVAAKLFQHFPFLQSLRNLVPSLAQLRPEKLFKSCILYCFSGSLQK